MKGVEVGAQSEVPVDPHQATRQKMIDAMQPLRPMERIDTLKQFLDHDRQVLRVSRKILFIHSSQMSFGPCKN